jgi:hypothetical protein
MAEGFLIRVEMLTEKADLSLKFGEDLSYRTSGRAGGLIICAAQSGTNSIIGVGIGIGIAVGFDIDPDSDSDSDSDSERSCLLNNDKNLTL